VPQSRALPLGANLGITAPAGPPEVCFLNYGSSGEPTLTFPKPSSLLSWVLQIAASSPARPANPSRINAFPFWDVPRGTLRAFFQCSTWNIPATETKPSNPL